MAYITSQASVLDSNGQIDSIDDLSAFSNFNVANGDNPAARPPPRKFWVRFGSGGKNDNENSSGNNGNFSGFPNCENVSRGACLIACSSILELIGNILALVYGLFYIHNATGFYEGENQSSKEKSDKEYWEKLEQIQFMTANRVGVIGLLATCVIGLVVGVLMPAGAFCRSWKSLRASMSLLFALCIAHIVLASCYLKDKGLIASLVAVPYRVYEILIIYTFINNSKKKKLKNAMKAADGNEAAGETGVPQQEDADDNIPVTMSINMSQNNLLSGQMIENPLASEMRFNYDLSGEPLNKMALVQEEDMDVLNDLNAGKIRPKDRKALKKRRAANQGDRKPYQPNPNLQQPDGYPQEYK